jgi:hypothetical protein
VNNRLIHTTVTILHGEALGVSELLRFVIARLRRIRSSCVQIEHRAQQLFLAKAITHQIELRLARGAASFQERLVRLGLDYQICLSTSPVSHKAELIYPTVDFYQRPPLLRRSRPFRPALRSGLRRASLTSSLRSWITAPFSSLIAFSASSSLTISTKAKPRG